MDSYQHLTLTESNGVLTITLAREKALNALNQELLESLLACFTDLEANETIHGVIITGQGDKAFCAGADISGLADLDAQKGKWFADFGQAVFRQIEESSIPVVAAINGFAFGGGCELAMCTHLRIASGNAKFGQPEVKLGIIPGYGGTQRLSRLVGKGRALDLCMTGRFIDADTAERWGLVSEVTTQADLLATAEKRLRSIMSMAPLAIDSVKRTIDRGYDMPLDDALSLEADQFALLCATADKAEGVQAFLEKREPEFNGE